MGFLVILTPGMGMRGLPDSNLARYYGVSWFGSKDFWFYAPMDLKVIKYPGWGGYAEG